MIRKQNEANPNSADKINVRDVFNEKLWKKKFTIAQQLFTFKKEIGEFLVKLKLQVGTRENFISPNYNLVATRGTLSFLLNIRDFL